MRKAFLGRGWKFPFQIDPATGGIAMSEYEDNIRECITLIIGTRPGERQMLPKFGCNIHDLMFSPNTHTTAVLVSQAVEKALKRWEPRIDVNKVDAFPDDTGTIRVQVHYTIKSTMAEYDLAMTVDPNS